MAKYVFCEVSVTFIGIFWEFSQIVGLSAQVFYVEIKNVCKTRWMEKHLLTFTETSLCSETWTAEWTFQMVYKTLHT